MKAAQQALRELLDVPEGFRFNTSEELNAAFEAKVTEISELIGRPIKDVKLGTEMLPGGQKVHYVEYVYGKKDGHGFATASSALASAHKNGFSGEVIHVVDSSKGTPIAPPTSTLTKVYGEDGFPLGSQPHATRLYKYELEGTDGEIKKIRLEVNRDGVGEIDIEGLAPNGFGPREMRALAAQLADEIPDLKTIKGERVSGARSFARMRAGMRNEDFTGPDDAVVDVTGLRGRLEAFRDTSGQFFVRGRVNIPETGWYQNKSSRQSRFPQPRFGSLDSFRCSYLRRRPSRSRLGRWLVHQPSTQGYTRQHHGNLWRTRQGVS